MTTNGRPMDDATLDALLGDWFAEGATTAPERIADQAMLEVTTAAQERRVLAAIQASVTSAPLAWAAAILVIAISIGLALGTRVVGPSPTPSPIPTDPTAWRSLTFEDQGFVLRLPPAWRSWTTAGGGIVHFVGPSGSFDVRLGADDGRMSVCTMTIALCPSISVDGLGDFVQVARATYRQVWSLRSDQLAVDFRDATVEGSPAIVVTVGPRRPIVGPMGTQTYVGFIHEGRPYLLTWRVTAEPDLLRAVLGTFRFTN